MMSRETPVGLMLAALMLILIACQSITPESRTSTSLLIDEGVDNSRQWQALDTAGGGGMTGIATHPTDPDVVYIASDNSGLFKTENGGNNWFSVSSNLGAYRLGFVTLDPLDPDIIYVTASTDYGLRELGGATGEIHRSLNGGLSWEFVSDEMGFQSSFPSQTSIVIPYDADDVGRFDRDGDGLSDVILVGAWSGPADPPVGGIWRSKDEGETFTHLALMDRNITALRAVSASSEVLYATTYEGEVYRSEDMGEHWVDISANVSLTHIADLAIHRVDRDILYVTCRPCESGELPVWKTVNGGQNWYPASAGLDSKEINGFPKILIDRFDTEKLYVTVFSASTNKAGMYQSTDGGDNWRQMSARLVLPDGRPYHWYKFSRQLTIGQAIDGRLFASGSGVWRYPDGDLDDGLEQWEPATLGVGNIRVNAIEVDPFDPTILYQGISDFGPYKSVDRGASFHRILGNGWPVTVDNFVWNGPYYRNYVKCTSGWISSGGTTDFAISRQDSNVVYSAFVSGGGRNTHGGVNKSLDGGATWQPVEGWHSFELNSDCVPYGFRHLSIDLTNDDILFAAQEDPTTGMGHLYRTTDGGATWTSVYMSSRYVTELEVSAADSEVVVFATGRGVFKSEQGGVSGSWQEITPTDAVGIQTISLSPHDDRILVVGTNSLGMYYTADRGENWSQIKLQGLFDQKLYQGSDQYLAAETATAFNPGVKMLRNIAAIVFDPIVPDTFYVSGRQYTRASSGVAKITNAGHTWQRLPLEGFTHRNVFDLAIDSTGEFLYAGTFNGTYRLRLKEG